MTHGTRPLRSVRRLANLTSGLPKWYSITNSAAGGPALVSIYDEIGFYGVPAAAFLDDLHQVPGDIELHLNSPGGDIYEGLAIYNGLLQARKRGDVRVIVDGLAASAASFIAMAASPGRLEIGQRARMMIHDGFCMAIGNAADMRELADQLDAESDNIAAIYADRTGKPVAYWREKMRAETWYTDEQAVAEGLADKVHGRDDDPSSQWDLSVFSRYRNADGGHDGWLQRDGKWVFDPMNDGDDDYQASTDTDHDYWSADGEQLKPIPAGPPGSGKAAKPMPAKKGKGSGNKTYQRFLNEKYSAEDRRRMAKSGEAMPDGSYPVADEEDLTSAIRAVGRGSGDHDAIRRHIIKRARALGHEDAIPDNWNSDGSISDLADTGLLASALLTALKG